MPHGNEKSNEWWKYLLFPMTSSELGTITDPAKNIARRAIEALKARIPPGSPLDKYYTEPVSKLGNIGPAVKQFGKYLTTPQLPPETSSLSLGTPQLRLSSLDMMPVSPAPPPVDLPDVEDMQKQVSSKDFSFPLRGPGDPYPLRPYSVTQAFPSESLREANKPTGPGGLAGMSEEALSGLAWQFPNAAHIQQAWKQRQQTSDWVAERAKRQADLLAEAETETSPLVSGWREEQAQREAYPSREQALGMTRSSAISAQAGITRANIAAQAVLQRAALDAAARGNLAESNRYRAKLDAFSRVAGLPQDEAAKKAMAFLLDELERDMPEIAAQISDFMDEESEDEYGGAIEGLRGAY